MSGGHLNYFYCTLEEHIGDFGDKELDHLVSDLAELFHDREWFLSGDTGEASWEQARNKFKEKWFTEHGRQDRIEKYLTEFEDEIRRTFGISKKYCKYCHHWKPKPDSSYGDCEIHKRCLYAPLDFCDDWTSKE